MAKSLPFTSITPLFSTLLCWSSVFILVLFPSIFVSLYIAFCVLSLAIHAFLSTFFHSSSFSRPFLFFVALFFCLQLLFHLPFFHDGQTFSTSYNTCTCDGTRFRLTEVMAEEELTEVMAEEELTEVMAEEGQSKDSWRSWLRKDSH